MSDWADAYEEASRRLAKGQAVPAAAEPATTDAQLVEQAVRAAMELNGLLAQLVEREIWYELQSPKLSEVVTGVPGAPPGCWGVRITNVKKTIVFGGPSK
jgi:hypothetical protein